MEKEAHAKGIKRGHRKWEKKKTTNETQWDKILKERRDGSKGILLTLTATCMYVHVYVCTFVRMSVGATKKCPAVKFPLLTSSIPGLRMDGNLKELT